jgi:hypothetical protein
MTALRDSRHVVMYNLKTPLVHAVTPGLSEVVIVSSSGDSCLPVVNFFLSGFVCEFYWILGFSQR